MAGSGTQVFRCWQIKPQKDVRREEPGRQARHREFEFLLPVPRMDLFPNGVIATEA